MKKTIFVTALKNDENIDADQGFRGLERLKIFTHISNPQKKEQIEFNKHFKYFRSVVEDSISHVRMWKICSTRFYSKIKDLKEALGQHDLLFK